MPNNSASVTVADRWNLSFFLKLVAESSPGERCVFLEALEDPRLEGRTNYPGKLDGTGDLKAAPSGLKWVRSASERKSARPVVWVRRESS